MEGSEGVSSFSLRLGGGRTFSRFSSSFTSGLSTVGTRGRTEEREEGKGRG